LSRPDVLSPSKEIERTILKNKVALVTGSACGIGEAIAERYGSLDASVVVNYSSGESAAQETAATIGRLGGAAIAVQADVSKIADIERMFAAALDAFGRLDIVVANAASNWWASLSSTSPKPISGATALRHGYSPWLRGWRLPSLST
jgi:NAD(P)-dependent dehydrogenase (short-subunit alcohol dehydrogenase family)